MNPESNEEQPTDPASTTESNDNKRAKKEDDINKRLAALDEISYASSLSSTPILSLKSPKANKSKKANRTAPPVKKSKSPATKRPKKADVNATKTNTKKPSKITNPPNQKKSHDSKNKSKSKGKSRMMSVAENSPEKANPPTKGHGDTKSSMGTTMTHNSSGMDTLSEENNENGAASRVDVPNERKSAKSKSNDKANAKRLDKNANGDGSADEEVEEEEAACYLCHCGVDCSDRALFFPKDRKKEIQESDEDQEYYFGMDDPYLPQEMYDPHNALVYCDSCDRMYHQKCHFVPILRLPQGDWNCLICSIKANKAICLPVDHDPKTFFASPPNPSSTQMERKFEFDSKTEKAKLWQKQLKSVKTFLSSQVSNIRLARAALDTLTSTKRNRAMILSNRRKSQELAQTLLRMTAAKYKIRQTLQSMESLRVSPCTNSLDPTKVQDWCQKYPEHSHHVVPHGINYFLNHRRVTPRTAEMKLDQERKKVEESKNEIPSEIHCSPKEDGDKESKSSPQVKEQNEPAASNDDDSGVTLDDLQCCICMVGDSTDDNDVILCDGQGCYRAFHMKCIHPEIKPQDLENEDEDWFCPLCTATSTYTHGIYDALREGEEDDSEDEKDKEKDEDEDGWDTPEDAFPNSQWEYETAVKFSQGKQNDDTNGLLALYLGDDIVGTTKATTPVGSDSEDESDYSLFDEESFAKKKKSEGDGDGDDDDEEEEDDSDRSSQATWLSSSVEMKIDKDELNALSDVENSGSDDNSSASGSKTRRRSRRLRSADNSEQVSLNIGVDFDEANIIEGKRRRKAVDYRKLNDALFGKLTEEQKAKLDDGADYKRKKRNKRKSDGDYGSKKKRAKSENEEDSSSGEKNGESSTKNSASTCKGGSEDASGSNGSHKSDSASSSDGSGSDMDDSGSDADSGNEDGSNNEDDSGSEKGSDSEDDED